MNLSTDALLRAVHSFGRPVTTREIAAKFNRPPKQIASRLNKLYGKLDREVVRRPTVPRRFLVWTPALPDRSASQQPQEEH